MVAFDLDLVVALVRYRLARAVGLPLGDPVYWSADGDGAVAMLEVVRRVPSPLVGQQLE